MKYNARRHYLHPVLRPYSDDYPEGSLQTQITRTDIADGMLNIAMDFDVSEPSILEQLDSGQAVCVAMLYCSSTLHRQMLSAGTGSLEISESIPTQLLRGNVELNPAIVVNDRIDHPTDTAHSEYSSTPVSIGRWHPLAVDRTWHFQVNPSVRPTKGIFNFETDDSLPDGEFDIKADVSDKYVLITANSNTRAKFKTLPGDESRPLATVFMSALVTALAEVKEFGDGEGADEDGWVNCIKTNLKRMNIDIGSYDEAGTHTLFRAAQLLLDNPFGAFITAAGQEAAYDDEEDES